MKTLIQQEEQTFRHVCDLYGIEIVFLFGSHAKNRTTTKSDLDIGVYLRNRISTMKIWELQCAFMDIYKRCDIDLVILNDASPLLLFDLLINHEIIYMEDERVLHNFFSWARKRYWQYQSHFKKYAFQLESVRLKAVGTIR
ncbi:MAG: type VII toxin-antitoxin system MntA family adenylyltransferase antitoxin [Candidatus Anammoxibacter sp.]